MSDKKNCYFCNKELKAEEIVCSKCGQNQRRNLPHLILIFTLLLAYLIVFLGLSGFRLPRVSFSVPTFSKSSQSGSSNIKRQFSEKELKSLLASIPEEDRETVLKEIVSKLESGELTKEQVMEMSYGQTMADMFFDSYATNENNSSSTNNSQFSEKEFYKLVGFTNKEKKLFKSTLPKGEEGVRALKKLFPKVKSGAITKEFLLEMAKGQAAVNALFPDTPQETIDVNIVSVASMGEMLESKLGQELFAFGVGAWGIKSIEIVDNNLLSNDPDIPDYLNIAYNRLVKVNYFVKNYFSESGDIVLKNGQSFITPLIYVDNNKTPEGIIKNNKYYMKNGEISPEDGVTLKKGESVTFTAYYQITTLTKKFTLLSDDVTGVMFEL